MQSAVSAIIFASIMSITTGDTTLPTLYPTYPPYPTYAPIAPTATCTGSTPGWVDADGAGCGWYEANEDPGCPIYGDYGGTDANTGKMIIGEPGSVANDNCCYCFGDPAPICTGSTAGWVDVDGYGCAWYEKNDDPGCPIYGDYGGTDANGEMIIGEPGSVPNDNCCYCFGDPPVSELRDDIVIECVVIHSRF